MEATYKSTSSEILRKMYLMLPNASSYITVVKYFYTAIKSCCNSTDFIKLILLSDFVESFVALVPWSMALIKYIAAVAGTVGSRNGEQKCSGGSIWLKNWERVGLKADLK